MCNMSLFLPLRLEQNPDYVVISRLQIKHEIFFFVLSQYQKVSVFLVFVTHVPLGAPYFCDVYNDAQKRLLLFEN